MASNEETMHQSEVVAERTRLESVFRSYDLEKIVHLLKTSRLSWEGSTLELIDRLVRFDLRRTFRAEAAPWDVVSDNDPSRGSLVPSLDYDWRSNCLNRNGWGYTRGRSSVQLHRNGKLGASDAYNHCCVERYNGHKSHMNRFTKVFLRDLINRARWWVQASHWTRMKRGIRS